MVFPAMMHMFNLSATSKTASAETGFTEGKTAAVVVPFFNS
jgi:hypothetical protein